MAHEVRGVAVGNVVVGSGHPLVLIAGPCAIEGEEICMDIAGRLAGLAAELGIPWIFKASYDKANRTSAQSFRGPGIEEGLRVLAAVKARYGAPILTDVHSVAEVAPAAEVADVLQLPAFLCRQTDLAVALGRSGAAVNIKKGQFLAPWDMRHVIEKVRSAGNERILLTERGVSFGYNNLVADMRSLPIMREFGFPVIFDATHSVQLPGGAEGKSGGESWLAPHLARAAVAAGCDAVFMETHIAPESALCDGANSIRLSEIGDLWRTLRKIDEIVRR